MRAIEYCDLNIMSNNRILHTVYKNQFISKYIMRDYNDQIIKGTTAYDHVFWWATLMFGYKIDGMRNIDTSKDFTQYDLRVKKIVYNP